MILADPTGPRRPQVNLSGAMIARRDDSAQRAYREDRVFRPPPLLALTLVAACSRGGLSSPGSACDSSACGDAAADASLPDAAPDLSPDLPERDAALERTSRPDEAVLLNPAAHAFAGTVGVLSAPFGFTVAHLGEAPTGVPMVALGGADGAEFVITTRTCSFPLGANDTCRISVALLGRTAGPKSATLTVSAYPGGMAAATLTGSVTTGDLPDADPAGDADARPADSPQLYVYPNVQDLTGPIGMSNSEPGLHVGVLGQGTTGPLTVALGGPDAMEFVVTSNTCAAPLAAGLGCDVTVALRGHTRGMKVATLTVTATPGGSAVAKLRGTVF